MMEQPALEHGSTRGGRWLRRYRLRVALSIAVVEALLLLAGVLDRWAALFFALVIVVGYFFIGSRLRPGLARDVGWTAAVSQALVALVPILVILVGTFALIAVGLLAVVALVLLFGDRH